MPKKKMPVELSVPLPVIFYGETLEAACTAYGDGIIAMMEDAADVGAKMKVHDLHLVHRPMHADNARVYSIVAFIKADETAEYLEIGMSLMSRAAEGIKQVECDHSTGFDENMRCKNCGAEL